MINTETNFEHFVNLSYLKSRVETGFNSEDAPRYLTYGNRRFDFNEEFANIYLVGLISQSIREIKGESEAVVTNDNIEKVLEDAPNDSRKKFTMFKSTADSLLLKGTVFDPEENNNTVTKKAKNCYYLASVYLRELNKDYTLPALTLMRISNEFDIYRKILNHMGKNHFNIRKYISKGELFHLMLDSKVEYNKEEYEDKLNSFLDLVNAYKETQDEEILKRMKDISKDLEVLNPRFNSDKFFNKNYWSCAVFLETEKNR